MSAPTDPTLPAAVLVKMADGGTNWLPMASLGVAALAIVFGYLGVRRTSQWTTALELRKFAIQRRSELHARLVGAAYRATMEAREALNPALGTSGEYLVRYQFEVAEASLIGTDLRTNAEAVHLRTREVWWHAGSRPEPEGDGTDFLAWTASTAPLLAAMDAAYEALVAYCKADLDELLADKC